MFRQLINNYVSKFILYLSSFILTGLPTFSDLSLSNTIELKVFIILKQNLIFDIGQCLQIQASFLSNNLFVVLKYPSRYSEINLHIINNKSVLIDILLNGSFTI